MKVVSNIIIAIGAVISILSACCVDSPGAYGYAAGIACILGGFVAGAGYAVRMLDERRKEKRKAYFYEIHRKDRLDADVEFIDLEAKK